MKIALTKRSVGAATALLTAGLVLAPAISANASVPAYCDSNSMCLWMNIHYVGINGHTNDTFDMTQYAPYFSQFYYDSGLTIDKSVSSAYNSSSGSSRKFTFYFGQSCTGAHFSINAGGGDSDFTNGSPTVVGSSASPNDAARSGAFANYSGYC